MEPSLVPLGTAEARVKYIRSSPEYRIQCTMSVIHYCIYCRLYHIHLSMCMCAYYLSRLVLGDFFDADLAARDLLRRGQD